MENNQRPGLGKALVINFGLIAVISLFIAFLTLVNIQDAWIGFLFLWFYASVKHASKETWLPTVCGSLFGFALSGLLIYLPAAMEGWLAYTVFIAVIFLAVLLVVMGRLPIMINDATFLFLTVGCIPFILEQQRFEQHFLALVVGIAFWSVIVVMVHYLMGRRGSPA